LQASSPEMIANIGCYNRNFCYKINPKQHQMHTLKKPFTLLLIFSHLNAFVLGIGGMANIGCLMHLQKGAKISVKHWVELLDN
jgi:hypothetical protein